MQSWHPANYSGWLRVACDGVHGFGACLFPRQRQDSLHSFDGCLMRLLVGGTGLAHLTVGQACAAPSGLAVLGGRWWTFGHGGALIGQGRPVPHGHLHPVIYGRDRTSDARSPHPGDHLQGLSHSQAHIAVRRGWLSPDAVHKRGIGGRVTQFEPLSSPSLPKRASIEPNPHMKA